MSSDLPVPHSAVTWRVDRLFTLALYSIAVIAVSVFLMHGWGLLWAACVLLFWVCFEACSDRPKSWLPNVVLYLFMAGWPLGAMYFGPAWFAMSDYDKTGRCHVANEIRQLNLAIHNYESAHQHLPPAYKADAHGRPMHSWRILLLPFLSTDHGDEIFRQYRMDLPWDSLHNLTVAGKLREPLFGDESDPTLATYKMVSGPGTPFGADTKSKFPDNTSKQITIVEDIKSPVLWTKPEDVTPAQVVKIYDVQNNPDGLLKQSGGRWSGTYTRKSWIGLLDGSTQKTRPLADSTQLLGFCSSDQEPDGEISDLEIGDVQALETHGSANAGVACLSMMGLLVLMLLPAFGHRGSRFMEVFGLAFLSAVATIVGLPLLLCCFAGLFG